MLQKLKSIQLEKLQIVQQLVIDKILKESVVIEFKILSPLGMALLSYPDNQPESSYVNLKHFPHHDTDEKIETFYDENIKTLNEWIEVLK